MSSDEEGGNNLDAIVIFAIVARLLPNIAINLDRLGQDSVASRL